MCFINNDIFIKRRTHYKRPFKYFVHTSLTQCVKIGDSFSCPQDMHRLNKMKWQETCLHEPNLKNFNGRRLAANTWKTKVAKNYIETNVINIQPISTSKNKTTKGKDSLKSSQLLFGHMEKAGKGRCLIDKRHFLKNSEVCQNDQIITTFRILFFVVFLMMNNNWLWMALNCASNILQKFKRLINFRSFLMISGEIEVN